jgi:hypothetical protein
MVSPESWSATLQNSRLPIGASIAVRMKAPAGVSTVLGKSGRCYQVGENGFVSALEPDAIPLRIAGWEQLSA